MSRPSMCLDHLDNPHQILYDYVMTIIGNITDAQIALGAARGIDFDFYHLSSMGSYRQAFLVNGVVYKINLRTNGHVAGNEAEWYNYCKLKDLSLPPGCAIPKMSHYIIEHEFIIAAQYIEGIMTHDYEKCVELERVTGLWDIIGNIIISDGTHYLIDIAC